MLIAGIILIALGLVGLVLMTLFILKRRKGKTKEENTPKASYDANWRGGMYLGTVTCSNGTVSL